ncbi:MAG: Hsp20/alpha crystallin family protein [Leptospiraceae bacterium]|nr:Hsp20/alpha crystallin family protein [Leptospiraceae bacterium]
MFVNLLEKTNGLNRFWNEFDRLQEDFGNYIHNFHYKSEGIPVNIQLSEDEAIVKALVPGINPEELDITIEENKITLKGQNRIEYDENAYEIYRQEINSDSFHRTFHLPFRPDIEKCSANFKNGILEIKLKKSEEDKPKKIQVKIN